MSLLDSASLVMTPNAYKTSKLYSIVPTDGTGDFTVTRTGNTATRVNSFGTIEINRTNILQRSEEFDNAYWTKFSCSITANATTNPISGTLTADKIISSATLGQHRVSVATTISAGIYTLSIYAKAAGYNFIRIRIGTTNPFVLDLSNGSIIQGSTIGSVTSLANGWYRISVTNTAVANETIYINAEQNSSVTDYSGNGTDGIFIYGAQLEFGDLPTTYIPTTTSSVTSGNVMANVPRIDYTGGGCPKLLIEPSRTNLITYSEDMDTFTKQDSSISKNTIISIDGYTNGDKIIENSANSTHFITKSFDLNVASYTLSIFAKKGERRYLCLAMSNVAAFSGTYDLELGIVTGQNGGTASIVDYGNGWYRCIATRTVTTAGPSAIRIGTGISSTNAAIGFTQTYQGNGTSGLFLYGAQLEAGTYATSYIQTFNASVTRNAESYADTNASSLIGQTEGTLFSDFTVNGFNSFGMALNISNGTNQQYLQIVLNSSGQIQFDVLSTTRQALITKSSNTTNTRYKVACAYKLNDFVMYVNGEQIGTDTSGTIPTSLSRVDFDFGNASSFATCGLNINTSALWKTRLSNADLATLTSI